MLGIVCSILVGVAWYNQSFALLCFACILYFLLR